MSRNLTQFWMLNLARKENYRLPRFKGEKNSEKKTSSAEKVPQWRVYGIVFMSQKLFDFWTKIFFWSDFFFKMTQPFYLWRRFFSQLVTRLFFVSKKPFSERTWPSLSSRFFFTLKVRKTQFRGQSLSPLATCHMSK